MVGNWGITTRTDQVEKWECFTWELQTLNKQLSNMVSGTDGLHGSGRGTELFFPG